MSEVATIERTETAATETQVKQETEAQAEDLTTTAAKTETTDDEDEEEDPEVAAKVAAKLAQIAEQQETERVERESHERETKAKKDVKELYDTTAASLPGVIAPLLKEVPLTYTDDDGRVHNLTFTAGAALVASLAEAVKAKTLDGFNLRAREHHSTLDHADAVESALSLFTPAERVAVRDKLADVKVSGLPQAIKELWTPKNLDEAKKRFPHLAPQIQQFGAGEYKRGRENPKPAGEGGAAKGRNIVQRRYSELTAEERQALTTEEREELIARSLGG